jgi:hypothetical protein
VATSKDFARVCSASVFVDRRVPRPTDKTADHEQSSDDRGKRNQQSARLGNGLLNDPLGRSTAEDCGRPVGRRGAGVDGKGISERKGDIVTATRIDELVLTITASKCKKT